MPDINHIIGAMLDELKADGLLADDDPKKMSIYMRNEMFNRLMKLQLSKGKVRKRYVTIEGLTLNGVKMGRPPKSEETESRAFLRELDKRTKQDGKEVDPVGNQASGTGEGGGEERRDIDESRSEQNVTLVR